MDTSEVTERARRLTLPVGVRDHVRGAEGARVVLVEYGDLECPQCGQAYPILKELERRFAALLQFVFRHFPLTNIHPNAQRAAEAAEWAAARGAFWPMHDAIYETQGKLSEAHLVAIARGLLPSDDPLPEAWRAHTHFRRVKEDFLSGIDSGVTGTPTFFIDGVRHDGAWDVDSLGGALETAAAARDQRSG